MPKVVREDIDDLNAVLTITLEKEDYERRFLTELEKYRKQSNMRGFRKGKTPISVLKKMYGKAVLAEVVNDLLQRELFGYLEKENLKILGQPLPSEDQEEIEFELKNLEDYTFRFDLGLAPDFEIQGLDKENVFTKYEVDIKEELIDEEMERARKRHGERVFPETEIGEEDMIEFSVRELEGDAVKADGLTNKFSLLVSSVDNEAIKQDILSKNNGDVFRAPLVGLEKNADEDYVRRYYLGFEEESDADVSGEFELTIEEVSRIQLAELDETFFQAFFGEDTEVDSEEKAREEIRKRIARYFDQQADALLFRDIQEDVMEKNDLPLPAGFLKRWLLASNEELTEADVDKNYDAFAKNLQWTLIRNKLIREHDIQVPEDDIFESFKNRIRQYLGGAPLEEQMLIGMADRMMEDEQQYNQVKDELLTDKLHDVLIELVGIAPQAIGQDEFEQLVNEAREQADAKSQATAEEEE